jgi:HSP20 family protein
MKLLRRNGKREELFKPFENRLDYLKDELEDVFERAWRTFDFAQPAMPTYKQWLQQWPPLDIVEDELGVMIGVDVPGFGQKELEVEVEGKYLIIRGIREEKKEELPEKKQQVYRFERHTANFERLIPIPEYLDPEKIEAKYEKGMLTIRLPRLPGKAPKKVLIKTA